MSDETNPDLTALLAEHDYALTLRTGAICLCGYVPPRDSGRLWSQQDYHRAHLAEQITAAGFGPVRAVDPAHERTKQSLRRMTLRAESAEAALAGLRKGIEALADEWERTTVRARPAFLVAADELRDGLAATRAADEKAREQRLPWGAP